MMRYSGRVVRFSFSLSSIFFSPILFFALQGCILNGFDDFVVTGTAAEIPGYSLTDFISGRFRIVIEQRLCGYHHPRRTETALNGAVFDKTLLKRVRLIRCADAF